MGILVRDKEFYHKLIAIAVPVALQNLIGFAVSMADTVMLGMLGEVQLSASSIANQLGFIFMLLCFGIGGGSSVLVAQFWGKGDTESIRKVLTIMYRMLFVSAFIFMALAIFLPRQIIGIFTTDKDVISEAVKFLKIVGFSYLFSGITDTTVSVLRAVHTVKISLLGNISALVTNVFLNWVLIFGNLGAPAMGVEGAAIATCMARVIGVTIIIVYMGFFERKIRFRLRMLFSKKLGMLSNFIHNAMPVTLNELLWGSGMAVIAVIIGRMGREFTAANAICTVLSQLVNVALFGVASASAVIIGNTIGKGEYVRAKAYAHTLLAISFALGIVASGFVWILKAPILNLYNISETGKHYADQLISIYSILVIGISISCTCMIGILRGGGDNKIVLVLDVLFMWCLCIPFGFLTGIYLHWPVWAVFIILKFDEVFKVTFSLLRIFKGNWINNVTINLEESGENPKVTV